MEILQDHEGNIPTDFNQVISNSQASWKRLKRGFKEFPSISTAADHAIKAAFPDYIDQDRTPILIAWSVLPDTPKGLPAYEYIRKCPEGIAEADQDAFDAGIYNLNEWATDYAARDFILKLRENQLYLHLANAYLKTWSEEAGTLSSVKELTERNGDFKNALLTALFKHDNSKIDNLIQATLGYSTLYELAVALGRHNTSKIDLVQSTKIEKEDPAYRKIYKKAIETIAFGGCVSQPGVAEIPVVCGVVVGFGVGSIVGTANMSIGGGLAIAAISSAALSSSLPYAVAHETVHVYSQSSKFNGLMPVTLTKKQ